MEYIILFSPLVAAILSGFFHKILEMKDIENDLNIFEKLDLPNLVMRTVCVVAPLMST